MANQPKLKLSFSKVTLKKLKEYFKIEINYSKKAFEEWFAFSYHFTEEEISYLKNLIDLHELKLHSYGEEKLKAKFISPILNKVNFYVGELDDWYKIYLSSDFEEVTLSETVDYMIAKGTKEPEIPYFFLQEFKPSTPDIDPEIQLLAQMIVALKLNQTNKMKGAYIIGQLWLFALLNKKENGGYQYFISRPFEALNLEKLKLIYKNLQAIKTEFLSLATLETL